MVTSMAQVRVVSGAKVVSEVPAIRLFSRQY
jgi:hypothetical protein